MSEFRRLRIGPVVMKDEIEYFHEVHLLEELELAFAGLSEDGSRLLIQNFFLARRHTCGESHHRRGLDGFGSQEACSAAANAS